MSNGVKFSEMKVNGRAGRVFTGAKVRFSWMVTTKQESSRLIIMASCGDVLFDGGHVCGAEHIEIECPYAFEPCTGYRWQIEVKTVNGELLRSPVAEFETALFDMNGFRAQWIAPQGYKGTQKPEEPVAAPLLRKEFYIGKAAAARLYCCALGFGTVLVNGKRITEDCLTAPLAGYDAAYWYNAWDISGYLTNGLNCVEVLLGNGLYNEFLISAWEFSHAPWRSHPKLLLEIHAGEGDEKQVVCSDNSWQCFTDGPVIYDALRSGEYYDARRANAAVEWKPAIVCRPPGGKMTLVECEPLRVRRIIAPSKCTACADGKYLLSFDEDISGWVVFKPQGLAAGQKIMFRYGEILKDGQLDISHTAEHIHSGWQWFQTDMYIAAGEGNDVAEWSPSFTYHGFRYIEVSGLGRAPREGEFNAALVGHAIEPRGQFESSDAVLDKVQQAAVRATITNFHWLPTDCPHREKNGWTGDAALSAEQFMLNYNPANLYYKWLDDLTAVQLPSGQIPCIVPTSRVWGYGWGTGPAWDSALFSLPYAMYLYNGDRYVFKRYYGAMQRYMDFIGRMANGGIVDFGLGDWCPPGMPADGHKCPTVLTDTMCYAEMARITALAARVCGKNSESQEYQALYCKIKNAFRSEFVNFADATVASDSQTAYAVALYYDLIEKNEGQRFANRLDEMITGQYGYHADCGIIGSKCIYQVLGDYGYAGTAYRMAVNPTYPSFADMINRGATVLWETFEGKASRNHHMYASISAWFYKGLAGLRASEDCPGFEMFTVEPCFPEGLNGVNVSYRSVNGPINVNWRRDGGRIVAGISIPLAAQAEFVYRNQRHKLTGGTTETVEVEI